LLLAGGRRLLRVKHKIGDQCGQIDHDQKNQHPENKPVFGKIVHVVGLLVVESSLIFIHKIFNKQIRFHGLDIFHMGGNRGMF